MTKFKVGQKWRMRNDASAVLDRDELIELICKAIGGGDKVGMVDFHVAEDIADALLARPSPDALDMATKGGGVMGDAPERIWAYGRTGYSIEDGTWDNSEKPNCSQDWPHEKYIRADFVDAIIFAAQAVIDRWDSPDWKDEKHTADYINVLRRALNTPETRAAILADAMKGHTND
jgi:hypothetical protein